MVRKIFFFNAMSVGLLSGCGVTMHNPAGETKFVTVDQESDLAGGQDVFLIEKVHEPIWQVFYGFADNNHCGSKFSDTYTKQIEVAITKILHTWLQPLQSEREETGKEEKTNTEGSLTVKGKIASEFKYMQVDTVEVADPPERLRDRSLREFISPPGGEKAQLGIIFYCQKGSSLTWLPRLFVDEERSAEISPIILNIYEKWEVSASATEENLEEATEENSPKTVNAYEEKEAEKKIAITDLQVYQLAMLMHQTGHAFGLRDVGGADASTAKLQQLSFMNISHLEEINVADTELKLPADDTNGIKWLYRYHVSKDIELEECPVDYKYDKTNKGCFPVYPLIFVVKQGNLAALKKFMQENPDINIDAQDIYGNTALHYVAEHARVTEDRNMYDYLLTQNADTSIRNKTGQLAADVIDGETLSLAKGIEHFICGTISPNIKPISISAGCGVTEAGNSPTTGLLILLPLLLLMFVRQFN